MSGYQDPEEPNGFLDMVQRQTFVFLLLAPILIGSYLLVRALSSGSHIVGGIGALVLGSAPIMIYAAWRADLLG